MLVEAHLAKANEKEAFITVQDKFVHLSERIQDKGKANTKENDDEALGEGRHERARILLDMKSEQVQDC